MPIPVPGVSVARLNPVPLPIRRLPFGAADASIPVPPSATLSCGTDERTPDALLVTTPAAVNDESVTVLFAASVVTAAVDGVVVPSAVPLMPVAVVTKLFAVISRLFAPVLIVDAPNPDNESAPEVAVRSNAPVVWVKPFVAVNNPSEVT